MKMEDILTEIHERKRRTISDDRRKVEEKLEKEIRKGAAFKQAQAQFQKLLEMLGQQNLKLVDGGYVSMEKLSVEIERVDAGKEFEQRQDKLDKAFLDLKIAVVTAGKPDQQGLQSLIKGFSEESF